MLQSFFRKPQPTLAPAGLKLTGVALAAMMAFAGAVADKAQAQDTKWPTHSMTMIIPFAAGGPTDVLGRIVGQHLSEVLKQQVVIQNLGGAGGTIGSERVDLRAGRLHVRARHRRHPRAKRDDVQETALYFRPRISSR